MIVSWNIRGLNKVGKLREISSRLLELKPAIVILVETRVKKSKENVIRNKLHLTDNFIDNYKDRENGRIWIWWDNNEIDIYFIHSSSQHIHWMTVVYAHNQMNKRRILWK
ncbi:unnamed protein product [Lathyrus sativus]|nr:unnamed protein product [Lathyrus sativus]